MFSWLEKVRQKPSSSKRFIAFSISLLFTGILFVVWLSVWLPSFFHTEDVTAKNAQFETPSDNVMGSMSTAWSGIASQISDLKNAITNFEMTSSAQYKATTTAVVVQATTTATTTQSTEMSTSSGLKF